MNNMRKDLIGIVVGFSMIVSTACSVSSTPVLTNVVSDIDESSDVNNMGQNNQDEFDHYEKIAHSDFPEAENMHIILSWNNEDEIPAYAGNITAVINANLPYLHAEETTTSQFIKFSSLDKLGRSGSAMASVCMETMPHKQRLEVTYPHPSGWFELSEKLGANIYQPCHILGYDCVADDTTLENFFTGTNSLSTTMAIYEKQVTSYVQTTGNHVMYRVTPVFYHDDLVAQGVQIEAYSVEDNGSGVSINTFIYNIEPGYIIDYATGSYRAINKDTSIS